MKNLRQAYGLTEATTALTVFPANSKDRPGSSGIPLPYMSLTIRDAKTGNYLGPGEIGEICIKGPLVMNGYYKNQEATKNSFDKHGWLLSGDLGYYDEDGYLYVVERIKELIKYKAYQVNMTITATVCSSYSYHGQEDILKKIMQRTSQQSMFQTLSFIHSRMGYTKSLFSLKISFLRNAKTTCSSTHFF